MEDMSQRLCSIDSYKLFPDFDVFLQLNYHKSFPPLECLLEDSALLSCSLFIASDLVTFDYHLIPSNPTDTSISDCFCSAKALAIALAKSLLVSVVTIHSTAKS